jgi:hypothetical protein
MRVRPARLQAEIQGAVVRLSFNYTSVSASVDADQRKSNLKISEKGLSLGRRSRTSYGSTT